MEQERQPSRSVAPSGYCTGTTRLFRISKTLSQILRHKAEDFGIALRSDGYCKLDDVLWTKYLYELNSTRQDVNNIVKESDKKS